MNHFCSIFSWKWKHTLWGHVRLWLVCWKGEQYGNFRKLDQLSVSWTEPQTCAAMSKQNFPSGCWRLLLWPIQIGLTPSSLCAHSTRGIAAFWSFFKIHFTLGYMFSFKLDLKAHYYKALRLNVSLPTLTHAVNKRHYIPIVRFAW